MTRDVPRFEGNGGHEQYSSHVACVVNEDRIAEESVAEQPELEGFIAAFDFRTLEDRSGATVGLTGVMSFDPALLGSEGTDGSDLAAFLAFLRAILETLAFRWLLSLIALVKLIRDALARRHAMKRLPVRLRRAAPQRCVKVSDPAYKRPDPLIYDQFFLMQQGLAVTWDNPDIELREGGLAVPSHALKPDTEYDLVARIWNGSTEAPIVGLPVQFSYLSFGVGTTSHGIGQPHVNLGVKGGPNHPAFATVKWRTPKEPGHYCIRAWFTWLDDVNPNNNLGQENTNVVALHSPAELAFRLRNDTPRRQRYRFEADAYTIPPLEPCRPRPKRPRPPRQPPGTVEDVPPRHDRRNSPLPPGWSVSFDPEHPLLAPAEEITVTVSVNAPDGFTGTQAINVHAFNQEGAAGGVTLYVEGG